MSAAATAADPVRHAATVILLRDGSAGPEVFLIRRHGNSEFFGGAFAFPGGKLDAADSDAEMLALLSADEKARARATLEDTPGRALSDATAPGLFAAACRELFEEVGVLLTEPEPGAGDLSAWRAAVAKHAPLFAAGLRERGLKPAVEGLVYWAHWITPALEPKRYDTRFFVARLPPGIDAVIDDYEATEGRWLALHEALAAHANDSIFLPPPTQYLVAELAGCGATVAAILAVGRHRRVVPIQPKITLDDGGPMILLPWHPAYNAAPGEGIDVAGSGISQFVIAERRWS